MRYQGFNEDTIRVWDGLLKEKGKRPLAFRHSHMGRNLKAEQYRCINEKFEAQQREIEALKALIIQMTAAQFQPPSQPLPKDDKDLERDQFVNF